MFVTNISGAFAHHEHPAPGRAGPGRAGIEACSILFFLSSLPRAPFAFFVNYLPSNFVRGLLATFSMLHLTVKLKQSII